MISLSSAQQQLSPSPVHKAFDFSLLFPTQPTTKDNDDDLLVLDDNDNDDLPSDVVTESQRALLKSGDEHVMEYSILSNRGNATAYVRILLGILDRLLNGRKRRRNAVSRLRLEDELSEEEACHVLLYEDHRGVLIHYAITKLCEVVVCLKENNATASNRRRRQRQQQHKQQDDNEKNNTKGEEDVTILTTFYGYSSSNPSATQVTVEQWKPLFQLLRLDDNNNNRSSSSSSSNGYCYDDDAFVQRGAAVCLVSILLEGCPSQQQQQQQHSDDNNNNSYYLQHDRNLLWSRYAIGPLRSFVSWIGSRLQSSPLCGRVVSTITPCLSILVTVPEARLLFDRVGGIGYITRHLRVPVVAAATTPTTTRYSSSSAITTEEEIKQQQITTTKGMQQLYELCFCLWVLSFDCKSNTTIRNHFQRDGVVPILVQLIQSTTREKVIRMALACLKNLATCPCFSSSSSAIVATPPPSPASGCRLDNHHHDSNNNNNGNDRNNNTNTIDGSTFLKDMVSCSFAKTIEHMKLRQWADEDILDDINTLYSLLENTYKELTTWDVYENQVESGRLRWDSMIHTEQFFRQHARKMEARNFSIVKKLISLLDNNYDDEVVAIACYDIGEFVKNYPNGRSIVKRFGAKEKILNLLSPTLVAADHGDDDRNNNNNHRNNNNNIVRDDDNNINDNNQLQWHALNCISKILLVRNHH